MRIGYARVSTTEQDETAQTDALTEAGCERIYVDRVSGAVDRRLELDRALDTLRAGDTLVIWRLDRLGRSLKHLLGVIEDLDSREIGLASLTEAIDTTTPGGRLVFALFGAIAEFERELIRERTYAGLAAARARGRKGGRPRTVTDDQIEIARQLRQQGKTMKDIAATLGLGRSTLYRYLPHTTSDTGLERQD